MPGFLWQRAPQFILLRLVRGLGAFPGSEIAIEGRGRLVQQLAIFTSILYRKVAWEMAETEAFAILVVVVVFWCAPFLECACSAVTTRLLSQGTRVYYFVGGGLPLKNE